MDRQKNSAFEAFLSTSMKRRWRDPRANFSSELKPSRDKAVVALHIETYSPTSIFGALAFMAQVVDHAQNEREITSPGVVTRHRSHHRRPIPLPANGAGPEDGPITESR